MTRVIHGVSAWASKNDVCHTCAVGLGSKMTHVIHGIWSGLFTVTHVLHGILAWVTKMTRVIHGVLVWPAKNDACRTWGSGLACQKGLESHVAKLSLLIFC